MEKEGTISTTTLENPNIIVIHVDLEISFKEVVVVSPDRDDISLGNVSLRNSFNTLGIPIFYE